MNNIKGDITTNATDMKLIIRGHYEQIYKIFENRRNGQILSIIWITKSATRRLTKLTSAVTINDI